MVQGSLVQVGDSVGLLPVMWYKNNLCRLALLAGAELEKANNDSSTAIFYANDAKKIKDNMIKYLNG